ncbi:MAG: hypothetical protein J6B28_00855 [Eubacterium sp.]|nr:hypothetical protein [Eubacterium sp.]
MKTLYLHIGTPKTGTSAIQHFLLKNNAVLAEHGYRFPKLPCAYTYARDNRNGYFITQKQGYAKGLKQILTCFEDSDHVILTEENLWRYFHTSPTAAQKLKDHADANGYQIRVIVYLRRQDEYMESLWKENIKHAKHFSSLTYEQRLSEILENESFLLTYASRLDALAEVFGQEQLIIRRYEKDTWKNGLIIDDFLDCIGLEHTEDFRDLEKPKNLSLSANTAQIMRIINKNQQFTPEEKTYLVRFVREISPDSQAQQPCSMLSTAEAEELLQRFAEENTRVANEYINDGNPLFQPIQPLIKWTPDNPQFTEDMIRLFSITTIDLKRENAQLHEQIDDLSLTISGLQRDIQKLQQERASIKKTEKDVKRLSTDVKKLQSSLQSLKNKLKHPFRTLWNRLFHR